MPSVPQNFVSFPFEYHQEIEIQIDNLSNMGMGVGRVNDWVVFVPFTLPGERVRARIFRNEKNCSHADLIEILTPSPQRCQPVCPVFGYCGGCQYQHLEYEAQLDWKTAQVADLLRLQANIEVPVNRAIASPKTYNYRSKITPHFQKPKGEKMGNIGFLKTGSRHEVTDVKQCPIAMEEINAALPLLRSMVHKAASQYRRGATLLMRASEGTVITNNRAVAVEHVGDLTFSFLAGDFFQNNPFILSLFTGYVAKKASEGGTEYLVDAYCGSGLFSLTLARNFKKVMGVEVSESSADWARCNARTNGIDNAEFMAAGAEAIFAQIDFPAEKTAVVIDPPRKGCGEDFLRQLFAFGPARVVYVSCNPATQIRDLAWFNEAHYGVVEVQPFDLFPQTRHLECVVTLEKQ